MHVVPCGPERADEVHRLTQTAFAPYRELDPPSGALRESVRHVIDDLAAGGGAVAELDGRSIGCLRWHVNAEDFHVRRVAVEPQLRRRGVGRALMEWADREARRRGCSGVTVGVRIALPGNLAFFKGLGFEVTGERRHDGYDRTTWLLMRKATTTASDASGSHSAGEATRGTRTEAPVAGRRWIDSAAGQGLKRPP